MLDKNSIKKTFKDGTIKIKSVNKNGVVEYKKVTDVLKHFTLTKKIHKIILKNKVEIIVTEDHSLFTIKNNKLKTVCAKDNPSKIVYIENDKIKLIDIEENKEIEQHEYMYDLSVEDNENFVLTSGILAHNSFAPPSSEATIAGFTETRGFRWPDEQLFSHLLQARNYINLIPPDTDFDLDGYPAPWQSLLLLQAMSYALWDLSILWISEEFNYDVNGISLDLNKSDKYQGAASAMQDMVNSQAELAKSRIHIIKGLAQSRYTFGRGAALGPWCLFKDSKVIDINNNETITIEEAFKRQIKLSYSMNLETNELIENEVVKIWSNGIQELYKMNLENGSEIKCTKTHVFFSEDNEEKELQKLEIGQKIWVKDLDILKLSSVKNVEKIEDGETYDMEMKEPYRNYVAENIIVHNTGGQNIKRWVSGGTGMGGVRIGF